MSRDFEDDDHRKFITITHVDDADTLLSVAAFRLHAYATVTSLCEGNFGSVPDDYLGSIGAETDLTALELELTGLWERVNDGYQIRDLYMLQAALQADERVREMHKLKDKGRTGHQPGTQR